jgi:hypothetical protein
LSIGLEALERLPGFLEGNQQTITKERELKAVMEGLKQYAALTEVIDRFWLEPEHEKVKSWTEHRDINMVMLATSLAPDGYLTLYAVSRE